MFVTNSEPGGEHVTILRKKVGNGDWSTVNGDAGQPANINAKQVSRQRIPGAWQVVCSSPSMTDDALIEAIKAQASAQEAHRRLDKMNGSIDRLGVGVGDLRIEVQAARSESKSQADAIIARIDRDQASEHTEDTVRASLLDTRWKLTAVIATIAGSSVFAVLATFIVRSIG